MALAIFDLDQTLLSGDSDHAFGQFLVDKSLVNRDYHAQENDRFLKEYQAGTLDIHAYLAFCLKPLTEHPVSDLKTFRKTFVSEYITPMLQEKALNKLAFHKQRGDYLLIITATNRFVTEPIAELLQVDDLIATEPELIDGRYTGKIAGTPSFQDGKITRLHEWLEITGFSLEGSFFYSDSHNDLPLLKTVDYPVAVDPDPTLKAHAEQANWPVISFRQ